MSHTLRMATSHRTASPEIQPDFLRVREVARRLGVSDSLVRTWGRKGTLRIVRMPGTEAIRIPRTDVDRFAAELMERA